MKAEIWQPEKHPKPPPWPWRTVRTLATNIGEPVIRLAKIPGAFFPGVNKALDSASEFTASFASDLNISPLDGFTTSRSLDGCPPPVVSKDGNGPVFLDGVETSITATHNRRGKEPILLERIDLCVSDFVAGSDPYYSNARDGEAIVGAGFIEPMRIFVEIGANGANPAQCKKSMADGKTKMVVALSENFLDTEPAGFYLFKPDEAPVLLTITLTALDAVYYETCLRFFYRVAGRELRQYTSDPIVIYTDGI